MRQLDTELRRFFARRLVRGAVLLAVLIAILSISIVTVRGHPAPANQSFTSIQPVGNPVAGNQVTYGSAFVGDTRINVGHSLEGTLQAMAIVMLFLGVLLGASFVGADFNVGSLTSQLLYEPRRWRVHLAKTACVAIGCAVVAAVICVVIGALTYGGSELHGIVTGITATWWRHRTVDLLRALAAASAAGVMGYSATIFLHRTAAAVVAFFVQSPLVHVPKSTPVFGLIARFEPYRGLQAITSDVRVGADIDIGIHTNGAAFLFVAVWIVILVVVSGVIFSRSEVR